MPRRCTFFLAPDDAAARAISRWPGGPAEPPRRRLRRSPAAPSVVVDLPGVEPLVVLPLLHALLLDVDVEDLEGPMGALLEAAVDAEVGADDGALVVRVDGGLLRALREADAARLSVVAGRWGRQAEALEVDVQTAVPALRELAMRAGVTSAYCRVEPWD